MEEIQAAIGRLRARRDVRERQAAGSRSERLVAELLGLPETASLQRDHMVTAIRQEMVSSGAQLDEARLDRVLAAMRSVPREHLVHPGAVPFAYLRAALDIGHGQTISHPQMVAAMLYGADIGANDRILDVGTGSGYLAAVAATLARAVVSIELVSELASGAAAKLDALGFSGIECLVGDARSALSGRGQFDVILAAAGAPAIPAAWIDLLKPGGRLVMPVGLSGEQRLVVLTRTGSGGHSVASLGPARFVPLMGAPGPNDIQPENLDLQLGAAVTPVIDR